MEIHNIEEITLLDSPPKIMQNSELPDQHDQQSLHLEEIPQAVDIETNIISQVIRTYIFIMKFKIIIFFYF